MSTQTALTENWGIVGHNWAIDHLKKSLLNGRARHAYLLTGPSGIGKTTVARAFAARLMCEHDDEMMRPCGECLACKKLASGNHPDLTITEAERVGGTLKIEQIRGMMQSLSLRPYEGRYRIGILRRFHEARPQAADALLKTLEEPPPYVVLLLTAENTNLLPKTILSRCQPLRLRPVPISQVQTALVERWGADPDQAELLAQLSGGRMGWAVRALTDDDALNRRDLALEDLERVIGEDHVGRFQRADLMAKPRRKDELSETLILWQSFWRDVILVHTESYVAPVNKDRRALLNQLAQQLDLAQCQTALHATRDALIDLGTNVNVRLSLENMFLDYPWLRL